MQYRKKPVIIEAFQMTLERSIENGTWPEWLHRAWGTPADSVGAIYLDSLSRQLVIRTLEGVMQVSTNDWVIKGIKGELYPCKPDIFAATYELVEE